MINFLLNFAVPRYYFTALKPGDSFGGDGILYGHVELERNISEEILRDISPSEWQKNNAQNDN